jgi:hypothetical protein
VFDWACESDPENPPGVGYILMEKREGKPLVWRRPRQRRRRRLCSSWWTFSSKWKSTLLQEIESIVSSSAKDAQFSLQGLAQHATFRVRDGEGPLCPFPTPSESLNAILKSYLEMMASGELGTRDPLDTFLVHRYRVDAIDNLWNDHASDGPSFLKHPDDNGYYMLVNDLFDIVEVIDWEWTCTVPKAEAFCSPCMMCPVGEFYSGSNEPATDELRLADIFQERGPQDLASCVMEGGRSRDSSSLSGLNARPPTERRWRISSWG